jgi:UDP-N-acetylmuramoyl-tripeptide--D-alanyl-D-alanine ligase
MGSGLIARGRTAVSGAVLDTWYARAVRHRRASWQTLFIGVTGSAGKTSAKDLIWAALAARSLGLKSPGTHNASHWVPRVVLRVRPDHDFCVMELGATGPGSLDRPIALVRPKVAVVTNVGGDHRSSFRTLEATAAEKGKLVAAVPPNGLAVLNADDPLVLAMGRRSRARVITFGLAAGADVRAEAVSSAWPDRLAFVASYRGERVRIQTRFCGEHWVHAVLAALATAVGLDMPLQAAAEGVGRVEPWSGRLSPVAVGSVTFIRDECKASLWSVSPALRFLRQARAPRKIAVIGTLSDYAGRASSVYAGVAREALESADEVLFVGPQARRSAGARTHPRGAALHAFDSLREASEWLEANLRPDDLVLLKGSQRADHLLRLLLARQRSVACWRRQCRRLKFCDQCLLLRVPELPVPRLGLLALPPEPAGG